MGTPTADGLASELENMRSMYTAVDGDVFLVIVLHRDAPLRSPHSLHIRDLRSDLATRGDGVKHGTHGTRARRRRDERASEKLCSAKVCGSHVLR